MEAVLTAEEKDEIVREGVVIMEALERVIGEAVDGIGIGGGGEVRKMDAATTTITTTKTTIPSIRWLCLKHVFPIGMVELLTATLRSVSIGMSLWRRLEDKMK